MAPDRDTTLEAALTSLERDAEATGRAATAAARAIKALQKAVKQGELRKLDAAIAAANQAVKALGQQFANTKDGWSFDAVGYLSSGEFAKELIECARKQGVNIREQDELLYCYPSLVRILPNEQCVKIDKVKNSRLRPTVLASHLKEVQRRPPRFRPEAFLESLYEAYRRLNPPQKGLLTRVGRVVRLLQIYDLLTIRPGQSREYRKAEFARDIYLLDRSGVIKTRNGAGINFHAGSGREPRLQVITEKGGEKFYFGISFDAPE